MLQAIARALRLDEAATAHLLRLGSRTSLASRQAVAAVSPDLLRLMDGMSDWPALVVGAAQDILAANGLAKELYSGFAQFDNLLRMIFRYPFALEFYVDWDAVATTAVANLRASAAQFPGDARIERVVGELAAVSPAVSDRWARYEVRPRAQEDKHFRHPDAGELHRHFESLAVISAPGQHLSVYTAEPGSPSGDGLALLRRLAEQRDASANRNRSHEEGRMRS